MRESTRPSEGVVLTDEAITTAHKKATEATRHLLGKGDDWWPAYCAAFRGAFTSSARSSTGLREVLADARASDTYRQEAAALEAAAPSSVARNAVGAALTEFTRLYEDGKLGTDQEVVSAYNEAVRALRDELRGAMNQQGCSRSEASVATERTDRPSSELLKDIEALLDFVEEAGRLLNVPAEPADGRAKRIIEAIAARSAKGAKR